MNGNGKDNGNNGVNKRALDKRRRLYYCYWWDKKEKCWRLYWNEGGLRLEDISLYAGGAIGLHEANKCALVSLRGVPPEKVKSFARGKITVHKEIERQKKN